MASNNKALLMILDGWGIGDQSKSDVIYQTPTPYIDNLFANYPNSQLGTSGEKVGLPEGQMGNSEVGHLNIGAGRIIYQDLVKINKAVKEDTLKDNPQIVKAYTYAKENNKKIHFIGLVSDGGVHSMNTHLYGLIDIAKNYGLEDVYVHAITDGRDVDPKSGKAFIKELDEYMNNSTGKIASICGRYYAMDRDMNWDRIKKAYNLYVSGEAENQFLNPTDLVEVSYQNNVTDEFILPAVRVDEDGNPVAKIEEGDVVICFNYRTDRLREITMAFTQEDHPEEGMKTMPLEYYTMTCYNANFKGINVIFDKENIENTLGEIVANKGLNQLRIAETEKYAHVTFFFSGGKEDVLTNEERILVASPKVATYDLQPEMSAPEVTEKLVNHLNSQKAADFICLNFANLDMVGHTGIYEAIEKAVKTVDNSVEKVVETAKANGYDIIIIADHGNADFAVNQDGSPNTAHTTNPVPCIWVTNQEKTIKDGILADVAPTILDIMNIEKPAEMTGESLIK